MSGAKKERHEKEELECGHPASALGKVNDSNHNEDVHCLWCGDIEDLGTVLDNLGRVYCHVTSGKVSNPMTEASVVIALADDDFTDRVDECVKEETEEMQEALAAAELETAQLREALKAWHDYDALADVSASLQAMPDGERMRAEARFRTDALLTPAKEEPSGTQRRHPDQE